VLWTCIEENMCAAVEFGRGEYCTQQYGGELCEFGGVGRSEKKVSVYAGD
jgi:hypothetical protein